MCSIATQLSPVKGSSGIRWLDTYGTKSHDDEIGKYGLSERLPYGMLWVNACTNHEPLTPTMRQRSS